MAKNHLPKRILGVKAPKWVRRGPLGEALGSRIGQRTPGSPTRKALRKGGTDAGVLLEAFGAAAHAFAVAMRDGPPGVRPEPASTEPRKPAAPPPG
jgi:hypothetical protein